MFYDYYIGDDLIGSKIYIAPTNVDKEHPWLIEFETKWEAESYFKKLIAKLVKDPIKNKSSYTFLRVDTCELGDVYIYKVVDK